MEEYIIILMIDGKNNSRNQYKFYVFYPLKCHNIDKLMDLRDKIKEWFRDNIDDKYMVSHPFQWMEHLDALAPTKAFGVDVYGDENAMAFKLVWN